MPATVATHDVVTVPELHYIPLPADVTSRVTVTPLPPAPLKNKALPARIIELECVVALANAKLAAAECLGESNPGSNEADACVAAMKSAGVCHGDK